MYRDITKVWWKAEGDKNMKVKKQTNKTTWLTLLVSRQSQTIQIQNYMHANPKTQLGPTLMNFTLLYSVVSQWALGCHPGGGKRVITLKLLPWLWGRGSDVQICTLYSLQLDAKGRASGWLHTSPIRRAPIHHTSHPSPSSV